MIKVIRKILERWSAQLLIGWFCFGVFVLYFVNKESLLESLMFGAVFLGVPIICGEIISRKETLE